MENLRAEDGSGSQQPGRGATPTSNISISLVFLRKWCNSYNSKTGSFMTDLQLGQHPEKNYPKPRCCIQVYFCLYAFGDCVHEWLHSLRKMICQCWSVFGMNSSILNPSVLDSNWSTLPKKVKQFAPKKICLPKSKSIFKLSFFKD